MLNTVNKQNDKIKGKSIDHTSRSVNFRNKMKAFQKDMCSLTCLRAHLNKIQEHVVLILKKKLEKRSILFVMKLELWIMKHVTMVDLQG